MGMNISEYYEYKKDNDKQIADYNKQQEEEKKENKQKKDEKTKEQLKSGLEKITALPETISHFTKVSGAAAILGALGAGANALKEKMGK